MDKVGIKTDYDNRLRVIGEMISGDLDGLVAVLGNGLFVVTKEAYEALIELGIEMQAPPQPSTASPEAPR